MKKKYNLTCLEEIDMTKFSNDLDQVCFIKCSGDRNHKGQHYFEVPFLKLVWSEEVNRKKDES